MSTGTTSTGPILASSPFRGSYYVSFTGRYAYGRPDIHAITP
jgi:hypothetical protein